MLPVIIKIGDKLRISAKKGFYSRDSFLSQIGDVLGEKLFLVYTPTADGSFLKLPTGQEYVFLFYTENGLVQANGAVLEHVMIDQVGYMKIETYEYQRLQRRHFYRLDCILNFGFVRAVDHLRAEKQNEEIKKLNKQAEEVKVPFYEGVTKDISGGGLRFVSKIVLDLNETLIINFNLNPYEKTSITVEGTVKYKTLLDNYDDKYEYRIEFVNIRRAQQEQIVQYIFNLQNKLIKRFKPDSDYDL